MRNSKEVEVKSNNCQSVKCKMRVKSGQIQPHSSRETDRDRKKERERKGK